MIKTEYDIKLSIDSDIFEITVAEPSLKEKKELEFRLEEPKKKLDNAFEIKNKIDKISRQIEDNQKVIEINKELTKESGIKDRVSLFLENKTLLKENSKLSSELMSIRFPEFESAKKKLDEVLNYKNELLIGGKDRDRLFDVLREKNIENTTLWEEISRLVAQESQKK